MFNYRYFKKRKKLSWNSWSCFDYYVAEEVEDSKWVLININFDYWSKIKADVGQHLIDQPKIRRAEEILSGCEEISFDDYDKAHEKFRERSKHGVTPRQTIGIIFGIFLFFLGIFIRGFGPNYEVSIYVEISYWSTVVATYYVFKLNKLS